MVKAGSTPAYPALGDSRETEGQIMTKRKSKAVSFDAMVKFFMQQYNIPSKKDFDRLLERMERMEKLIRLSTANNRGSKRLASDRQKEKSKRRRTTETASDVVLEIIRNLDHGVGHADIQTATGFDAKKIRNILYRLHKTGRIERVRRGIYRAI
jgi:hypothetical protein